MEAAIDFSDAARWSPMLVRQTLDRLRADFLDTRATNPDASLSSLAQAFGQAALKLQDLAGYSVSFSAVRPTAQPGHFLAAIEYVAEPVGQAAEDSACRLLRAAREGQPLPLQEEVQRLRDLASEQFPQRVRGRASIWVIHEAARARGIPTAQISPDYWGCVRLGQGSKQHRCVASEPDTVSAFARMASTDKHLAKQLFQDAGIPVPPGRVVEKAEDAWKAACELGLPVAVKPLDSDLAAGVSLDLRTAEQVAAAFIRAREHSADILVERFAPGLEHRVLVVGNRVSAVARIEPPHVIGDGISTVTELVDRVNRDPRRAEDGSGPLFRIKVDDVAREVLAAQGCTPASVPAAGAWVLLRRNPPYFSQGGNLIDLTDCIHPSTAAHAVAAAQMLQIPVAGMDVVALDISKPLEEQGGVFVEINVSPGLWLHLAPWADSPRPVGKDIVESLFPPGEDGRIPVAALVGDRTGAATRHLSGLLAFAGLRAGSTAEGAISAGGRTWETKASTPQARAAILFQNPAVDVAILKPTPQTLLRDGFGNDRCDVGVLLEIRPEESDPEPTAFLPALRHALPSSGVFVLSVDGIPAGLDVGLPRERIILVAEQTSHPTMRDHLAAGGKALFVQGENMVLAQGKQTPIKLGKRPAQEVVPLLAALAAGFALGQDVEKVKGYLRSLS
jgi:cyanophycin synthetase